MPANACWGIEIGAYALKAIKLEREGDQLRIADYAFIPHRKVLSTPEVDADDVTRLTIGSLVSQYDLSHADIAVSVPGHMAFARFAKLPPVEPKKIPDIVRFEAVQQIPFPIDEVVWDFQTFVSESSPDVEVGIFAITNERIEDRLHMWSEMGLDPNVVTISPVAVYNAIVYDEIFSESTPGTIILDIGTTSTDLIIAEEGRTWIRTFPLGGHQFTLELAETFKLTYAKAEKLKREAATSSHKRQILQAMRPVFGDVVSDVQQSIGYYESLHPDCQLTKIIGIGSTFQLPGMRKYLSQQLQMEVVRLDDFKRAKLADNSDVARFNEHIHNYVTAYGLALQGLGDETIRANLMPKLVLRKQMWHQKTKWFATAAAVSVIASGAMFVRPVLDGRVAGNNGSALVVEQATRQVTQLQQRKDQIEQDNQVGAKTQNAFALLNGTGIWPMLAADISEAIAASNPQPELLSGDPGALDLIPPEERRLFWLERMEAVYLPPTDPEQAAGAGRPAPIPVRGEDEGFGMTQIPTSPIQAAAKGEIVEDPTLVITLTIRTTHKDSHTLANQTIAQWLRDHGVREGVPYQHLPDVNLRRESFPAGQEPSSRSSGQPGRTGVRQPDRGGRTSGGAVPPRGVEGSTSRGPRTTAPGARVLQDLMGASQPPPPAVYTPEGTVVHECTLTWHVILKEPGQNEDEFGGDA